MPKKLSRASVNASPKRPVKVIQFGEGNFLRAFADWIIDILNEKTTFNGAINIVQPLQKGMGEMINAQDGLYHVVLNGLENGVPKKETRLITCVNEVINPYQSFQKYLDQAGNPELKFVLSNTTEAGINFNPADADLRAVSESFPGKLTSFLYHRFVTFAGANEKGLIFFPCELIDKNGDALRKCILQYADHWKLPGEFSDWIKNANVFCNTLVDRIVPGFPAAEIKAIQEEIGFDDNLVVTGELFHLWVIEAPEEMDKLFPVSGTGLQVKFVNDLTPYRTRKVRILNGAHTAMVPYAYLRGLRTVQQAVEDRATRAFIDQIIFREVIPTLDLPKEELDSFAGSVIERFQNPFIRHELSSIALNSVSKFKVRVLPSLLRYQREKGTLPQGLVDSLSWLIAFYKMTWQGDTLPVNDVPEVTAFFTNVWSAGKPETVVQLVLSNTKLWDEDLSNVPGLSVAVTERLHAILQQEKTSVATQR